MSKQEDERKDNKRILEIVIIVVIIVLAYLILRSHPMQTWIMAK